MQYVNLPTHPRRFTQSKIIEAIRQRQQAGLSLSWTTVCMENRALANAAKNSFRSWRLALVAAGLRSEVNPPVPEPQRPPMME